jgi:5'-nucleotidase
LKDHSLQGQGMVVENPNIKADATEGPTPEHVPVQPVPVQTPVSADSSAPVSPVGTPAPATPAPAPAADATPAPASTGSAPAAPAAQLNPPERGFDK